jgi:hypothetical protein
MPYKSAPRGSGRVVLVMDDIPFVAMASCLAVLVNSCRTHSTCLGKGLDCTTTSGHRHGELGGCWIRMVEQYSDRQIPPPWTYEAPTEATHYSTH